MDDAPDPEPRRFLLADGTIGDEIDAADEEVRLLEARLTHARHRASALRIWRDRRATEGRSAA